MENALLAVVVVVGLLLAGSCSCRDSSQLAPDGRIVGGEVISAYYLPYQVSVRRRNSARSAYAHSCGGALLDERTVLTAAHCVYNRQEENFLVVAGTELRAGMDGGVVSRVERLVPHELYNASITDNDIALIFVTPPFPLDSQRKIATIEVGPELPPVGTLATVSGWGMTTEDGFGSTQLRQVQVPLVDREVCQTAYNWRPITEGMLCAAASGGGKDACQGDNGGPLVVDNKVVGIVSFGEGCARAQYPGVYAAVPYFQEWIAEQRAAYA
ncbi:trypsin eta [Drosophila virilis]|uniref:trypsin eta n=1 Tax=Drosophila virilis TaxID=7244 RepID=UPI00017D36CB|nr:trypsin eta [Drosophila virilis]